MEKTGYVLYDEANRSIVKYYYETTIDDNGRPQLAVFIPSNGDVVHCPLPGERYGKDFIFLEKWRDDPGPPTRWHQQTGSQIEISGVRCVEVLQYEDEPSSFPTSNDVNQERDARISAGFEFNGKLFQFRESDRENINGAGTLAALAIMGGAQPGDYLWHGGKEDFVWITSDNSLMKLDAFDTVNLGKAAAAWKSAHIFAARTLKDQSPIPEDYWDDKYWPPKVELA